MLLLLPLLERGAAQESRTCTSIRPCFIGTINSAVPDGVAQFSSNSGFSACSADSASYESGEKDVTTAYKDWQEAGGLAVSVDTVIEFDNIPDDAYGCELFLTFVGVSK
jgi:hypothetical protein